MCESGCVEDSATQSRELPIVAVISREIVAVLKEASGRGPTKARTHLLDDSVLVLLREGHTKSEESLYAGGREVAVAEGRVELSETMREALTDVIERNVGRKVAGFMSSSQQHPDLISFVFVLETSPLFEVIDGDGKG